MSDDSRQGVFQALQAIHLAAEPINPGWVLDGSPQARRGTHSTNVDGWAATNVWDCTAGRFNWHFVWEETVMILEGEVRVTNAAGQTHVLVPGSVGYFPAGSWWVWEVPVYVRKLAFGRRQVPWLVSALGRLRTALATALRGR
jgi:uncharacterized cupin superfamily protein